MTILLTYLLKVSISLAVVHIFYQLALRKLTFYNWNRFYLLGYTALSFVIPFIDVSRMVRVETWESNAVVKWVPVLESSSQSYPVGYDPVASFDPWYLFTLLLLSGMILLIIRFLVQWLSFRKMLRGAELIQEGEFRVYKVSGNIIPFSFGRSIFINPALHNTEEIREIILHEFVHARQKHSIDIIWSELLCLLNWYNPFAWMIRRSIRQNLEFIADQKVLDHGIDRKQYQYLLLKVIGNKQFSIASKFNFSSLKKRIAMMNKMRSAGLHLLKFLFILPLLAVLLLAFRRHQSMPELIPASVSLSALPAKDCDTTKPPTPPLAPLAPIPPAKPANLLDPSSPLSPLPPFAIVSAHCDPAKNATPVASGTNLITGSSKVKEFEITQTTAVMKMKDGTVENYDLTNKEEKSKFEEKYGKIYQTGSTAPVAFASGTNGITAITIPPGTSGDLNVIDDRGHMITGGEDVIITISNTTTREQLDQLVLQMKEKGIELKFENVSYNDGKITSISGSMKKKESNSNFTLTDFKQFTLAAIEKDGKVWLKVSTDKKNDKRVI
jgi:hypothetical protein